MSTTMCETVDGKPYGQIGIGCHRDEGRPPAGIAGSRRAEPWDLPDLQRLTRPATRELFGDERLERLYETCCLSVVQYDHEHTVVSGMCLSNYPNVPSVPPYDWPSWLHTLYRIPTATARNTMFVHLLVWDEHHAGEFLAGLLAAVFDITTYCEHVILVMPPRVSTPAVHVLLQREMTRVSAKGTRADADKLQYLEEDNDDLIPIIDRESTLPRQLRSPYYISEMIRYPDGCHQLIIGEDVNGTAAGVVCLNSAVDVDQLDENFQLTPYHGLRKPREDDEDDDNDDDDDDDDDDESRVPEAVADEPRSNEDTEETSPTRERTETSARTRVFFRSSQAQGDSVDYPRERGDVAPDALARSTDLTRPLESKRHYKLHLDRFLNTDVAPSPTNSSRVMSLSDLPAISDYFDTHFQSRLRGTVFSNPTFESFRGDVPPPVSGDDEATRFDGPAHPAYRGEVNAFVLETLAMRKDARPHWSRDLLEAAFSCFPRLDYCLLLLPSSHPCRQFLQHFVRVPSRCDRDLPEVLYVAHRAIFRMAMECRHGQVQDRRSVEQLVLTLPARRQILADFDLALDPLQPGLECFVFKGDKATLGLAILRAEKRFDLVRSRYHVEDHAPARNIRPDEHGRLLHYVLMPIFAGYHRFFIREVARLSGWTVMFYRLRHQDDSIDSTSRAHSLASCLNHMIPVDPRGQARYRFPIRCPISEDDGPDSKDRFSLFVTSPRLAMVRRTIIDTRIVIVGASDCGVALAEHLALRSAGNCTQFASLTLISPHGLPYDVERRSRAGTRLLVHRGRFCAEYRRSVAANTWTDVVHGTVIAINRKERHVTVSGQGNLPYDFLILTCGLQYQKLAIPAGKEARLTAENRTPWNCLTVNDDTEASVCLERIRWLTGDLKVEKTILFYGRNVDCYCALDGLIELGVKPAWITLIEPRLDPRDSVLFHDCEVDEAVTSAISRSGVKIFREWDVMDCSLTENDDGKLTIESVTIERDGETRCLACDVLFSFREKTIGSNTFLAFSRAGLVFDGLLVIDPRCRTNDPCIFAAGTVTKYSRRFHAGESRRHAHYSSVEIGERLAHILREAIDGHIRRNVEEVPVTLKQQGDSTLPVFRAPLVTACVLPGGNYYLHVRKPGGRVSHEAEVSHGEALVTGSCTSKIGYFRIELDAYDSVETVTCFSKKMFQVHDMIALYGKHESMLNQLKSRFRNSSISDFYAYFREPWAPAIFHDRFECLRAENRATLRTSVHGVSLLDDCVRALIKSKWQPMSEQDRRHIVSRYAGSVYHRELEKSLVRFLECCEDDLPMYCTALKQRLMYMDHEESPLYFEQ